MLRFLLIALLALAARPSNVWAVFVDWDTLIWTPGTLSNSYDVDPNSPGNDITITIGGDTQDLVVDPASGLQTPARTYSLQGGGPAGQLSLELATTMIPPNLMTVTVTFSPQYLLGVQNVSFSLFDIDQEEKQDLITDISARGVGGVVGYAATITNIGSSVSHTGAGFGQRLRGIADSPDTGLSSGNGNATISFGSNAIQSFTFTFDSTPGGPKLQKLALGDISFTPVPEINPAIAAGGLCLIAGVAASRRYARKKRQS